MLMSEDAMLRIRENFVDFRNIILAVDGELNDKDLGVVSELIEKYLDAGMDVCVSMVELSHIGLEGKAFLQKIQNSGVRLVLPDYLKIEMMIAGGESGQARD